MQFAASTIIARSQPLEGALEAIARAGFGAVEISYVADHLGALRERGARHSVIRRLRALGLTVTSLHMPHNGQIDISSLDAGMRQRAAAAHAEALEICADLACPVAVIHPNAYHQCDDDPLYYTRQENMKGVLAGLLPAAERYGVSLAVENMIRYQGRRFGCDHRELRPLADEFDHPNLGLCVDTTHALLCGLDPAEQVRLAGARLIATHLSDDDGRTHGHWVPGEGAVNWPACWNALRAVGYAGTYTFEVYEQKGRADLAERLGRYAVSLGGE